MRNLLSKQHPTSGSVLISTKRFTLSNIQSYTIMHSSLRLIWVFLPILLSLLFAFSPPDNQAVFAQKSGPENELLYLGEKPPTTTPAIFAPGLISQQGRYEFGCSASKDGKEFYFAVDHGGQNVIYETVLLDGSWTEPKPSFSQTTYSYNDPMLTPDEDRMFFISNRALDGKGDAKDIDIWFVERRKYGWSDPIHAGSQINTNGEEYFCSFAEDGTLYFASNVGTASDKRYNHDIYAAAPDGDLFKKPVKLNGNVNTTRYEADVCIAPDDSYLIFCSTRNEGLGRGDLYISFRDKNGEWLSAQNMGSAINTEGHELCPFLTRDGKYFFYTSREDIYWVSTEIIEQFRP